MGPSTDARDTSPHRREEWVLSQQPNWDDADEELDTRKSPLIRVVAAVVIVGLVIFIADLFFSLVLDWI
jgi:hypothetical protein